MKRSGHRRAIALAIALALGSLSATAADRYQATGYGPYPSAPGPTDEAACWAAVTAVYSTPDAACQGSTAGLPKCDRADATYQNYVATLTSPTSCFVSWQFQNKGSTGWGSWSANLGIYTCKDGWKPRTAPQTGCEPPDETNTAQLPQPKPKSSCEDPNPGLGDPIFPLTGALKEAIPTGVRIGGVELVLHYDTTSRSRPSDLTSALNPPRSFGPLWQTNFHHQLLVFRTNQSALLARGDGTVVHFTGGAGGFVATGGIPFRLTALADGYLFADILSGALERYDTSGQLLKIESTTGNVLSFSYNADGTVLAVADADGRTIRFEYANGLIAKVTGPDGATVTPAYDGVGNLQALKWPDGKSLTFQYENSALPWAMTGKTDEKGQRVSTFTFDSDGRAVAVEGPGGTDRYSVSYASPPVILATEVFDSASSAWRRTLGWQPASGIVVTGPNGQTSEFSSQVIGGMPYLTSKSRPSGSGCSASTSQTAYDAQGRVVARDNFDGSRVCFSYDSSGREATRIEGLPSSIACESVLPAGATLPVGARRIATTWHPDWEMVASQDEALRRTTYVYNGQPDPFSSGTLASCSTAANRSDGKPLPVLCKQVVQAKVAGGAIDPSVPARTTRFAYNASGRPVTVLDANNRQTTYSYHTASTFNVDPYYGRVTLLLHGNGADGSTVFADSSPTPKSISLTGAGPAIRVGQSKFGGASLGFPGTGALRAPSSQDWAFGPNDDYTVEFWFYRTAGSGATGTMVALGGPNRWSFYWQGSSNKPSVYCANCGTFLQGTTILQLNTWYHYAVTKQGNTFRLFLNGTLQGTATTTQGTDAAVPLGIGDSWGGEFFAGYIDDLRISKGVARYITSFPLAATELANAAASSTLLGTTVGDLSTATDAAGNSTQFSAYDMSGRVRQFTDVKGVSTSVTYTQRGQVASVTTTPPGGSSRGTSYAYDPVGQVTGVTFPDGSTLSYEYDAAHRLTGITDGRGNSVTFTLDQAGNRVGEEFKDSAGILRRSIARSFDALNRVQQITGGTQ